MDVIIECSLWQCLVDMMDPESDFPSAAHPIHYFYGLKHFVTVGPVGR